MRLCSLGKMDRFPSQYSPHEQQSSHQPWAREQCYDKQEFGQNQYYQNNQYPNADQSQSYGYSDGNGYVQNENYRCGQDVKPGNRDGWHQQIPQQNQYPQQDQNLMNQVLQFLAKTTEENRQELTNRFGPQFMQQLLQQLHVSQNQVVQPVNDSPAWQETHAPPQVNQSQHDHFISQPQEEQEEKEIDITLAEEVRVAEIIWELSEKVSVARAEKILTYQYHDWFNRMGVLIDEVMDALDWIKTTKQKVARNECETSTTDTEWSRREAQMMKVSEVLFLFIQARRLEHENRARIQEVFEEEEEAVSDEVQVGNEIEGSSCCNEVSDFEIELGSHISPTHPIEIFEYGRFHVLPSEPPTIELKNDETLVEFVMPPTIYRSEQDCLGDGIDSFWDENELQSLEMEEVQILSTTPPPDEIQMGDLEGCVMDLTALFGETEIEKQEIDMGSSISPSLQIEFYDDVQKECMEKPYEIYGPSMVELPGELDIISMPVPDYYTLPPCVDEYYVIDFAYSPVDGVQRIFKRGQLPWNGKFKKKMMRDFDKRGFPSWEEVASRAMRGKFLVDSVFMGLAMFISLKLLVFLSMDFG